MASFYEAVERREDKPEESLGNSKGTYAYLQENYDTVAEHMRRRYGMTEENHSKDDIIESFENAMRGFNSGNSVRVASELAYLSRAGDEDIMASQAAYEAWDSAGSVFKSDAGFGEKLDAVSDYARTFLADPVNAASLGVGRIATRLGATQARKIALNAAESAATRVAKNVAAQGGNKAAQDQARRIAFAATQRQILRREGLESGLDEATKKTVRESQRRGVRADIAGTTGAEMIAAGGVDALYQQAQMKADRADEYSWTQGTFSTVAGGLGGALAVGMAALRGTSSLEIVSLQLNRQSEVALAAEKLAQSEAAEALSIDKAVEKVKKYGKEVREKLQAMVVDSESFAERVGKGELLKLNPVLANPEMRSPFLMKMIMDGDKELGIEGINQIFEKIGIPKWAKRGPKDTRTNYIADVLDALPKPMKRDIEKLVNNVLMEVDPKFKGFTLKEFSNFSAENVSNAARTLRNQRGIIEVAAKTGKKVDDVALGDILKAEVDPLDLSGKAVDGDDAMPDAFLNEANKGIEKWQRRWISLLITHPATTAVNAVGWAGATANQSLSDMFKGALYGGRSVFRIDSKNRALDRKRMSKLWGLQLQKIRNLVDPYDTLDNFMDMVTVSPQLQKSMFSYINGGVEASKSLVNMGVDSSDLSDLTRMQKVQRTMQTVYGVRAQDFLTKAQEYMYAMDKAVREEYGMTFNEFMSQEDILSHMVDKNHANFKRFMKLETKATNQALENIFAKSYADQGEDFISKGIGKVAGIIEDARNIPVIGTMVPFGQFFNNTIAYMLKATPINPMYHMWLKATNKPGSKVQGDVMESMAKMASGLSIAGMLYTREKDNLEEGLAWSEERRDGVVLDRALDFPYSYYKMLGRGYAHLVRDGEVPGELMDEFLRTFGTESITRSIGDTGEALGEIFRLAASGESGEMKEAFTKAVIESGANYISGATRVMDPFNQILASQRGEDWEAVDRQQGNQFANKAFRYVDEIAMQIGDMIGSEGGERVERESALTSQKPRANLGKLFGIREQLPATHIQKMFNEVGRAQWIDGITFKDQEAENNFREVFFPFIEVEAERLYDESAWKKLNLTQKTEILDRVLQNTRSRVRDYLLNRGGTQDLKTGLIAAISGKGLRGAEMREIYEMFQISPDELHELTVPQLQLFLAYQEGDSRRDERERDVVGIE